MEAWMISIILFLCILGIILLGKAGNKAENKLPFTLGQVAIGIIVLVCLGYLVCTGVLVAAID